MESIVLSYPRLKNRLKGREKETAKAIDMLYEIAADFSPAAITPFNKILDFLVARLYDGINVEFEDDFKFEEVVKNNCVVVVPNHQSHADYVALNYIVYKKFKFPLYVAGGINLNVFPIGKLFRKCGCFFIRRSFNSDVIYRLTLEAYLYYLLYTQKPIEFFFEGGRSRTGKLLSPKFGLYHLMFDAHKELPDDKRKPFKFVPVSILHEYVPEQKTLTRELEGAKKKKESFTQILKVFKIFSKDLGTIHMRFGAPIDPVERDDQKEITKGTAFECFKAVGRNMTITPSALVGMILLDEPSGALKWENIISRAEKMLEYCSKFDVPVSAQLKHEDINKTLERAMDQLISNKKAKAIGRTRFGQVFYFICPEARFEILYFKNTIMHHFIVPWMVNLFWINIFNGSLENDEQINGFFERLHKRLQLELYLPDLDRTIDLAKSIISDAVGRDIEKLSDCLEFAHKDLYNLASGLSLFSRVCSYIAEGHFIAARAIRALAREGKNDFSFDEFFKEYLSVFKFEIEHGNLIKYPESKAKPLIRNSLKYFDLEEIIVNEKGRYILQDREKLERRINRFSRDLSNELMFNVRES
jgi:glycerol-3-phosphate O-acyltransferase